MLLHITLVTFQNLASSRCILLLGENHHSTLTNCATSYEEGDYSPALDYLSEIFSDASRAAEFLVTESNFIDLALFWAKRILGVLSYVLLPPNTIDSSIQPRILVSAHPQTERDLFMECLCLCLPRCSKSPGLIQLLRDLVLELSSARVGMGRRKMATVFKYN